MTIRIDKNLCDGCGKAKEPLCVRICPGNLLYKDIDKKAEIRDKGECWDCAGCVKECPKGAIEMYLQPEIDGRGATLRAKKKSEKVEFIIKSGKSAC
ncbi:4Fe-4S dicluster domain-containing protein [Halonatronum saccharophilum]|uniref:4Fe-4S dicluster domain-containing protein n=1 Tax=Halonatronum saccharophilum TaxID=150060 RepID=UPI000485F21F|nr:4Fe-4S dicluster domain-containing protein [Halonatronum saccharophilum]